jgi:signal transduction histidine kinase
MKTVTLIRTMYKQEDIYPNKMISAQFAKIVTDRNKLLVLIVVTILNVIPAFVAGLGDTNLFVQFIAIIASSSVGIWAYVRWLSHRDETWAKVVLLLLGCAMSGWFTMAFLGAFRNSYLSAIILVQVIFLLLGARYGVITVGLGILASIAYIIVNPGTNILENMFTITAEATVGTLSWIFLASANALRTTAENSAEEAHKARNEAERLTAEVTKLNHMLLTSQDRERQRLARDIHDGPLQALGVELLAVERTKRRLDAGEYEKVGQELEYLRQIARDTVTDLRDTVSALRNSLLDSGIEPALRNLARKTQAATGLIVDVNVELDQDEDLPYILASCIYQLVVEGLNNIKKHANADNASITVQTTDTNVLVQIIDDGRGFDYKATMDAALERGHIGMYTMKERVEEMGGEMNVTSTPSDGTTINFAFPKHFRPGNVQMMSGPLRHSV